MSHMPLKYAVRFTLLKCDFASYHAQHHQHGSNETKNNNYLGEVIRVISVQQQQIKATHKAVH